MRLLDDVRLIESEVLAPPTASTFKRSITKLASYGISSVIVHSSMIGSHRWKKTGKITNFFDETRFEVQVKSPNPSQWSITVLSIAAHVAGYPRIGW